MVTPEQTGGGQKGTALAREPPSMKVELVEEGTVNIDLWVADGANDEESRWGRVQLATGEK
jgi:hypothetical protein